MTFPIESARILVVDDDPSNVRLLEKFLGRAGFLSLRGTSQSAEVARLFHGFEPDLLLLDLNMPAPDGFEVMHQIRSLLPENAFFPILVLTGDLSPQAKERALANGATDFLQKPFEITEVLLRVRNLLKTRFLHLYMDSQVRERTRDLIRSQHEILERLAQATEMRDDQTGLHTRRVGDLAARIAEALKLPAGNVELLRRAAPLHDLGKIGIPDSILLKPGPLTQEEFAIMKTHTVIGANLLAGGENDLIRAAERIALHHHERWDGAGYPAEIQGTAIPLEARIVALADFVDAVSHERLYRPAWSAQRVRDEIEEQAGGHFDPEIVEAYFSLVLL